MQHHFPLNCSNHILHAGRSLIIPPKFANSLYHYNALYKHIYLVQADSQ